jgi:hypothetical protein
VQTTVGPLIHDSSVQDMIAAQVRDQIVKRLPGGVVPAKLEKVVDKASTAATKAVLNDKGVEKAWLQVLDQTRAGYTQQVRSGKEDAGHIVMVLDPVADLASDRVAAALKKVGVKTTHKVDVKWRLSQDLSDVSPLMNLVTPALNLTVKQSAHWLTYALISGGSLLLGLLAAKRRAIVLVTAGFVALGFGLVGNGLSGMISDALKGSSNAVIRSIAQVFTDQVRGASLPVIFVGAAVLVVGIVIMVVTGVRRRRRTAEDAFDWDEE